MPPTDSQIVIALVVFALAVVGAFTAIVRRIPTYIDARMIEYRANEDARRKIEVSATASEAEERHGDAALAVAAAEVMKVFVTTQPSIDLSLKRLTDLHEGHSGDIGSIKTDVKKINHTLETGSPPLLSIGKQVQDIYTTVNEIKKAPSLTEDKTQRIEQAISDISKVTAQLSELVVALQETQAELLQRKYDSGKLKPIATYIEPEKPLTRDALDVTTDGKPPA